MNIAMNLKVLAAASMLTSIDDGKQ